MSPEIVLDGSFKEKKFGAFTVRANGLAGSVKLVPSEGETTRSGRSGRGGKVIAQLDDLLETKGDEVVTFVFELKPTQTAARGGTRAGGTDDLVIFKAPTDPNTTQVILYTDEKTGLCRWILPDPAESSSNEAIYFLPATPLVDPQNVSDEDTKRGVVTATMRRVVRLIISKADIFIEGALQKVVQNWEENKHPYGWQMLPFNQRDPLDWDYLRQDRCLLFLHGTFSKAESAFGALLPKTLDQLRMQYKQRLIAFNHPTLSDSPEANVARLLAEIPPNVQCDVITHSRGGLVGRELLRQLGDTTDLQIGKMIMVATPNQGTPLADKDHMLKMVDQITSWNPLLPDNVGTILLESLLSVVKMIAHTGLGTLKGLKVMTPKSEYLQSFNDLAQPQVPVYALGSNYQPADPVWYKQWYKQGIDKALDQLFGNENDGVVPTAGTHEITPNWKLPPERYKIVPDHTISHSTFFANPAVNEQLITWLNVE